MPRRDRSGGPSKRSRGAGGASRPGGPRRARGYDDYDDFDERMISSRKGEAPPLEEEDEAPRSGRRSRRGKGRKRKKKVKKKIDVMPVLMVGVFLAAGAAAALYFPMQKRALVKGVRAGERLGFDAAIALSQSSADLDELCDIVEKSSTGRMAAAAALALIARRGDPTSVVVKVQARLQNTLPADAKAAFAAALAQSRCDAGEREAAALAKDGNSSVRRAAVIGLAAGRSSAGPAAVGAALGDSDQAVREAAQGVMQDWAVVAPAKAVRAALIGLELEEDNAQVAAADVVVEVAGELEQEHVLALLSNASAQVRELGLRALDRNPSLVDGRDGPVAEAVVKLLDVSGQPVSVKSAALEVVSAGNVSAAGPKALVMLKSDPDTDVRGKAALAAAALRTPGAWEALVAPLLKRDEPRQLKIACLGALEAMRKAPPDKLLAIARTLLTIAEGEDKTLAGLALRAMKAVAGKHDKKYGVAQWRKYLARRLFEVEAVEKVEELFEKMKKEYEADPQDWERIRKTVKEAGLFLQENVIERADDEEKEALRVLVDEMSAFFLKIWKPSGN